MQKTAAFYFTVSWCLQQRWEVRAWDLGDAAQLSAAPITSPWLSSALGIRWVLCSFRPSQEKKKEKEQREGCAAAAGIMGVRCAVLLCRSAACFKAQDGHFQSRLIAYVPSQAHCARSNANTPRGQSLLKTVCHPSARQEAASGSQPGFLL